MTRHLISGSYERFVFAHKLQEAEVGSGQDASLEKAFSFPAHKGPVKCLAASAPFIASGGADDTVHIYNAKASKDLGFLMNPGEGAVTAIAFYTPLDALQGPTHLLSGSADGCIAVWAVESDWDCVKTLKGHKKEVTGLCVHPSGLLALSTARDDMLRMWNMAKGRSQYKTKIPPGTEAVCFSPDAAMYALLSGTKAYAHDVAAEGTSVAGVELGSRGLSMAFVSREVVAVGCENGSLQLLDTRSGAVKHTIEKAHSSRIRGLAAVPEHSQDATSHLLGSVSSDGAVKLWDLRTTGGPGMRPEPVCTASTAARLTCLTMLDISSAPARKQSKARAGAHAVATRVLANGGAQAEGTESPQPQQASKRKLHAREGDRKAKSAPIQRTEEAVASKPGKGTGKPPASKEQEQAKQESLRQAELKRQKREELRAAAEAQKSGVLVQKEAETVVEFPEVSRPPKAAKKSKRQKGK